MFIYDKCNGGVNVCCIENKMGIKGFFICELVYKNVKVEFCGDCKLGLIKYVMVLMNGVCLGIVVQLVGLLQVVYNEVLVYVKDCKQFGKVIIEFFVVVEIFFLMKVKLDVFCLLLYEIVCFVDVYKVLDDIVKECKLILEECVEQKIFVKLVDVFILLGKGMGSEFVNQNVYDCIQIYGGLGFMKDYVCECIYCDLCIIFIYEGIIQLQVVVVICYVMIGVYLVCIQEYENMLVVFELEGLQNCLKSMVSKYVVCVI